MFVNCLVEEVGEDGGEERGEVFDEGWFDLVDVAGFVWVNFVHGFGYFFGVGVLEFKRRVFFFFWYHLRFFMGWDRFACLVSNRDETIIQCIGYLYWVCVLFSFVVYGGRRGSTLLARWDHCFQAFCLLFWVSFRAFDQFGEILFLSCFDF